MNRLMTKERSIARSLAIFGAAWQLLWLISESGLRRLVAADPTSGPMLALAVSVVAWIAIWPSVFGRWSSLRRTRVLQVVIVATVFIAGIELVADPLAVGVTGWFVGASVVNLAAGLAGLYLPRRIGVAVVILIVAIETVVVVIGYVRGFDDYPLAVNLVYPLYALALGLASAASRHALMASARREDRSSADLEREQQVRASIEQTDAAVRVAETRLHETVLNTLTAIVRGGLGDDPVTVDRLRRRADEAADVLQRISQGGDVSGEWRGDLRIDVARMVEDLRHSGVQVELSGTLAPPVDADAAGYRAMGWAVREALINITRHARASHVRIAGDLLVDNGRTRWRVSVSDDGIGFDAAQAGFGVQSVLLDGLAQVGGQTRIAGAPGQGTDVLLEVPLPEAGPEGEDTPVGALPAIGGPVLVAFAALTVYVFGATWQYVRVPQATMVALAIFAGVAGVLGWAIVSGRYSRPPWWALVVVFVGVPVMSRVEMLGDAVAIPAGVWSSEAGAALLFIVVATGPWWAAPLALISWLLGRIDVLGEFTQPGTIVIVVAAILGWSLRRADARTQRLHANANEQRAALQVSRERLLEAGRRYADVDSGHVVALLRGIAVGELDPGDGSVREECTRQERLIRSVLPLHPERNVLHRDLVHLAVIARDRGIDLSISAAQDVSGQFGLRGRDQAVALLELGRPGSSARASTTRSGGQCVFRLVATIASDEMLQVPSSAEVLDEEQGLVAYEEVCASEDEPASPSVGVHDSQRDAAAGV